MESIVSDAMYKAEKRFDEKRLQARHPACPPARCACSAAPQPLRARPPAPPASG